MGAFGSKIDIVNHKQFEAKFVKYSHRQYTHLVRVCREYQAHLRNSVEENLGVDVFSDDEVTLAQKKYLIVNYMLLELLDNSVTEEARIENMMDVLNSENREILTQQREEITEQSTLAG